MVNTLYLEKEIENNILTAKSDKFLKNKLKNALNNKIDNHHTKLQKQIELEMKNKLTQVYNNASSFFWYPPQDLLTERYVR
jgi:predicted metal-dependent peptidase